jgi:hypothetical protein
MVLQIVGGACRVSDNRSAEHLPAAQRFDEMLRPLSSTALEGSKDSTGQIAGALVTAKKLIVLDMRRAELRMYDRATGRLIKVAGRPGADLGDLRYPFSAAELDSGRLVVYDAKRNLMSFRDSVGDPIRDVRLPQGYYGGFAVFPREQRVLLTGDVHEPLRDVKGKDVHEFDFSGNHVSSYGTPAAPHSDWERRFGAEFVAQTGPFLVTGVMNSSRLRLLERTSHRERWIDVAPGWQRLDWPSDALLGWANRQVVGRRIQDWSRQQRLMNGVFPVGGGRLLVRFHGYASGGDDLFYYVLTDTAGATLGISHATRANVVASASDTVFWIGGAAGRDYRFGVSIVPPTGERRLSMLSK